MTHAIISIKEAIYSSRLKPELNAQLQHNNDFCFLWLDYVINTPALARAKSNCYCILNFKLQTYSNCKRI